MTSHELASVGTPPVNGHERHEDGGHDGDLEGVEADHVVAGGGRRPDLDDVQAEEHRSDDGDQGADAEPDAAAGQQGQAGHRDGDGDDRRPPGADAGEDELEDGHGHDEEVGEEGGRRRGGAFEADGLADVGDGVGDAGLHGQPQLARPAGPAPGQHGEHQRGEEEAARQVGHRAHVVEGVLDHDEARAEQGGRPHQGADGQQLLAARRPRRLSRWHGYRGAAPGGPATRPPARRGGCRAARPCGTRGACPSTARWRRACRGGRSCPTRPGRG